MSSLQFEVVGARPEAHAAEPTLLLRLRVEDTSGAAVHAVALRCQIRIEPQRRRYGPAEEARLDELFGEAPRWGDTLRPFPWAHVGTVLAGFRGATETDLPVTCTYDLEVAAAKYFHALEDGEVPLILLFSGTVFRPGGSGMSAEPIGWDQEATFRLPVATWRAVMDRYFPHSGWLRLHHDTLDALRDFKVAHALPTWDQAIERLLKQAGEGGE